MNQLPESAYKILIVDDVPDNLRLLSTTLTQQGYKVRCAKNGAIALMGAQNDLPHLILLDINMPDLNGYEVCEKLKENAATRSIPIIFLSAQDDIQDKVKAFTTGAVDFISKPFQVEEVLARVRNQIALQEANDKVRMLNERLEQRVKERTSEVEEANRVLREEIIQRYQLEEKLRHDALHDSLTGLPNRSLFMQEIKTCLHNAIANPQKQFAILFIDLDRFKIINDSLGHLAGDELLIACARRLTNCIGADTVLARLGGDEFTILIRDVERVEDAVAIAEKVLNEFASPFNLGSRNLSITVSIGIVLGNGEYCQEIDLLRDADTALYRAKELGKARYEIFDRQMYLDAMRRLELETELREAIFRDELLLYYQPIFSLDNLQLTGFEALVRWQHPLRGVISPDEFVPLAEETGLIVALGEWVMNRACNQLKIWHDNLPAARNLTMSINVAGEQLHDPNFLDTIDRIIDRTQVEVKYLKLELTESMLIEDTEQTIQVLQQIKNRGIKISIDDFGTGYSSLSYLPQFPIDILKIDRSFVEAMSIERQNLEIIKTIVTLARVLNMQIIAEGIETDTQSNTLKDLKVEFGQGFLFSKPLTVPQAEMAIANFNQLP
ncbi:MAG: EAL domain-containing protein [Cyanobacteria bacterium P01_G01_bin.19]